MSSDADVDKSSPSIGVVWMEDDRSIVVKLRAEGPGITGDANLLFTRRHPSYKRVLDYVGGLEPGEAKALQEWDFSIHTRG